MERPPGALESHSPPPRSRNPEWPAPSARDDRVGEGSLRGSVMCNEDPDQGVCGVEDTSITLNPRKTRDLRFFRPAGGRGSRTRTAVCRPAVIGLHLNLLVRKRPGQGLHKQPRHGPYRKEKSSKERERETSEGVLGFFVL